MCETSLAHHCSKIHTLCRADALLSLTAFVAGITSSILNRVHVHTYDMLPLAAGERLLEYSVMSSRVGLVLSGSRKDLPKSSHIPSGFWHTFCSFLVDSAVLMAVESPFLPAGIFHLTIPTENEC